jgi:hypothetical protein
MRIKTTLRGAGARLGSGLLLAGLLLLLAGDSRAGRTEVHTLFVAEGGSGTACTQAAPCVLATAVAQAVLDDIIYVAGGTYTGTGDEVLSLTKTLLLLGGWDGTQATPPVRNSAAYPSILDGQGQRRVVVITGSVAPTVDGFVITGGYGDFSGGGIKVESAAPIIRHNEIVGNDAQGDGGAIFVNRGAAQILYNWIHHNTANWAAGLRLINNADVRVVGNRIHDNVADIAGGGIDLECCGRVTSLIAGNWVANNDGGSRGGGVIVASASARLENNILAENWATEGANIYLYGMPVYPAGVELLHNTLVGAGDADEALWVGDAVTATLTNNILAGHEVGIVHTTPTSSTISADHNLFWNASDPLVGTNPVQSDPLLDAAWHLTEASPARDAGVAADVVTDFDGDRRPIGGYDIGADEYALRVFLPLVIRRFP